MIGMSGYRAEAAAAAAHVAQQSRRNKLRVQPGGEQVMQVRDVYDPAMFSSTGVMGFGNPGGEFQYQEAMDGSLIGGQGMQFSTGYCENGLQEVVTSSSAGGNRGMVMAGWDGGNELLLLPSYGNQGSNNPRIGGGASVWMGRGHQQWGGGDGEFSVTQGGLSLSLASNPAPEMQVQQLEGLQGGSHEVGVLGSYAKIVGSNRGYAHCEGLHGGVGSSVDVRRAVGPLGPFTGYATILKSSKFLKPAQQLLVEFCNAVTGPNAGREGTVSEKEGGASLSSFYGSVDTGGNAGNGNGNGTGTVHRPEFQQKKAKLLVMQEEVCRRYKQYHQQMQMVVSSFESVSGLNTATPYTSLALKSVSKHFRCIKNAISDQIRQMSKMLGEELMSSPSSSRGDNNIATPRSKFIDQSLRKSGDQTLSGFTDHNPPVWRPQRGLPERSVAVLRAWLFEHFLHPYPTDTDKHMLATQTGLSRNQVSNWFINARVRLWKPMVEEIHMLETKGMAEMNLNAGNKNDGKMAVNNEQRSGVQSSKHSSDCSSMVSPANDESYRSLEQWHREKRSRMENCIVPGNIDGGLMSFYRGGMEMAGLGAVSLTLGLRHSDGAAAGAVHQPPPQQQQMTRHFGNQLVHDFVA